MMSEVRMETDEILVDTSSEAPSNNKSKASNNTNLTSSSEALNQLYTQVTVPPRANNQLSESDTSQSDSCFLCCVNRQNDSEIFERSQQNSCCDTGAKKLRQCLSSGVFLIWVLIATFVTVLLLLAELLFDLNLLSVPGGDPSSDVTEENIASSQTLSETIALALHWTSFSLMCLFFVEVLLRAYAWKLHLAKSVVAVTDMAVVMVSLALNLAATLAAGNQSPFDAMSLIIIFRFIRLYSLIQYYVGKVKKSYKLKLSKTESCQAEMQILNQRLTRQVTEKDFEIKQLRAHLGGDLASFDKEFQQSLKKSSENEPSYESDLQKAIALSKREYEQENGGEGYVNEGYQSPGQRMRQRESLPSIVVHHRENSIKRSSRYRNDDQPCSSRSLTESDPYHNDVTVNVITHGQLHSGQETDQSQGDTASLLHRSTNQNNSNRTWTVGYCLLQDGVANLSANKQTGNKHKNCDVTVSDSDEGIESVTSQATDCTKVHSRTNTSVSIATEGASSDQGCASLSSNCSESCCHNDAPPKLHKVSLKKIPLNGNRRPAGESPNELTESNSRL